MKVNLGEEKGNINNSKIKKHKIIYLLYNNGKVNFAKAVTRDAFQVTSLMAATLMEGAIYSFSIDWFIRRDLSETRIK